MQMAAKESYKAGTGCLKHIGERHASLHVAQWVKMQMKRRSVPFIPHHYGRAIFAE